MTPEGAPSPSPQAQGLLGGGGGGTQVALSHPQCLLSSPSSRGELGIQVAQLSAGWARWTCVHNPAPGSSPHWLSVLPDLLPTQHWPRGRQQRHCQGTKGRQEADHPCWLPSSQAGWTEGRTGSLSTPMNAPAPPPPCYVVSAVRCWHQAWCS